jgi:hypothetical protein
MPVCRSIAEGMMMKRLWAGAVLVLGSVSVLHAQEVSGAGAGLPPFAVTNDPSVSATRFTTAPSPRDAGDLLDATVYPSYETSTALSAVAVNNTFLDPAPIPSAALPGADPAPAPDPKFLYGGRDDYRWQLGIGASWVRFRSRIFNASAVGVNTSLSYYLNNWLGLEGNVLTGFAPEIFDREHVKLVNFTGGARIAWRQRRWEPWAHVLVGLSHEQPQTAASGRNSFAVQAGGGADYRFNPRLSFRLQGDWLHTQFFGDSQNNFNLVGGVVLHF